MDLRRYPESVAEVVRGKVAGRSLSLESVAVNAGVPMRRLAAPVSEPLTFGDLVALARVLHVAPSSLVVGA